MEKVILKEVKNGQKNYREEYILYLMKQFINATSSSKIIDLYSKEFVREFKDWLIQRQQIMSEYKFLLDCMDLEYDYSSTAEVGKGAYDSLAVLDSYTTLITPYAFDLRNKKNNKIIQGTLDIVDINHPKQDISTNKRVENIYSFMTHNPYEPENIEGWDLLHNSGGYRIILGIFGNTYDKDKQTKEELILRLKDKLDGNLDIEVVRNDDKYYSVATTKPPLYKNYVKKRVK